MDRQRLLGQMDKAWSALQASYAGFDPAEMTMRGVTEDWSVKDILAHVTVWQREALKHLPHILAGERPPKYSTTYGGIDAFNALMSEQARQLPLAQVLDELESAHRRLMEYLASVPDAELATDSRFRRRLRLDTYGHYAVHARMIQAWREELTGSIE